MASWPINLPQYLPLNAPFQFGDGRVRTQMDAGPPKVRRRYTALLQQYNIDDERWVFDEDQVATLQYFVETTLEGGTLEFTWDEPWLLAGTKTFRLVSFPRITPIVSGANRRFVVRMQLEELPT
jgi:hypothetical protein